MPTSNWDDTCQVAFAKKMVWDVVTLACLDPNKEYILSPDASDRSVIYTTYVH